MAHALVMGPVRPISRKRVQVILVVACQREERTTRRPVERLIAAPKTAIVRSQRLLVGICSTVCPLFTRLGACNHAQTGYTTDAVVLVFLYVINYLNRD